MTEFNWSKEKASIVVRQVDAVAVYLNSDGDVVIRQSSSLGAHDEAVVIPTRHLGELILALENLNPRGR